MDFWEYFQSDNVFSSNDMAKKKLKSKKRADSFMGASSARSEIRRKTPADSKDNFSDDLIKAAFYDLNLGLIEAYDEKKHFKVDEATQDLIFLTNEFIADSKPDIRIFLDYLTKQPLFDIFLQNFNHMADVIYKAELKATNPKYANHTFLMNQFVMEAAILPNFESNYEFILKGIQRKRENKSLEKLCKVKIFNTITVSSPKFEKLPYHQGNIFLDPLHEELMIHDKGIKLTNLKFNFSGLNFYLKDDENYNDALLNEENYYIYNKHKQNRKNFLDEEKNSKKLNRNETANILGDLNMLDKYNNEGRDENKFPLSLEMKTYILENRELFNSFFGFCSTAVKNFISGIEAKLPVKNQNFNFNNNSILNQNPLNTNYTGAVNNTPANINLNINPSNLIKNFKKSFVASSNTTSILAPLQDNLGKDLNLNQVINLRSKGEYIKQFNNFYNTYIKNNTKPVVEFKYNFGLNIIQTTSFCEYCTKPNNIWDVRREFSYSKTKKETTTKCKFCGQFFIPYFFVIEENQNQQQKDNKPKFIKKLKKNPSQTHNHSFQSENAKNESFFENHSVLLAGGNSQINTIVKRVEYMSFEHVVQAFYDYEVEEKNLKTLDAGVKKFPPSLFYNLCILAGEIRIKIDSSKIITAITLDRFFEKNHSRTNSSQTNNNNNLKYDLLTKDNVIGSAQNSRKNTNKGFNWNSENNLGNNLNFVDLEVNEGNDEKNMKYRNYNSNNIANLFNDFYQKKKKELEEDRGKKKIPKTSGKYTESNGKGTSAKFNKTGEKTLNIRFDLKDLMMEKKYKRFVGDIQSLQDPQCFYNTAGGNLNHHFSHTSGGTRVHNFNKNNNQNKSHTSKFILSDEKNDENKTHTDNLSKIDKNIFNRSSKLFDNIKLDNVNREKDENELIQPDAHDRMKFSKRSKQASRKKNSYGKSRTDSAMRISVEYVDLKKTHSKSKSRSKSIYREKKGKIPEFAATTTNNKESEKDFKSNQRINYTVENFNVITNENEAEHGIDYNKNYMSNLKMLSSFVDSGGFVSETKNNSLKKNYNKIKINSIYSNFNVNSNHTKSPVEESETDDLRYRVETKNSKPENSYVNNYIKKIR